MTDFGIWQDANNRYLAAALHWLRLLLEQRSKSAPAPSASVPVSPTAPPEARGAWRPWMRKDARALPALSSSESPFLLPSADPDDPQKRIDEAAAAMADLAQKADPPPAILLLAKRLELSAFEQNVLLLCAAMELDTGIAGLCARAQQDHLRPFPTFALALTLFAQPSWDSLSPERPLRFWRLIEINQTGNLPLTASPLRADERVVNYLKGVSYLDDRLSSLVYLIEAPPQIEATPPSQSMLANAAAAQLKQGTPARNAQIVQLLGPDSASKQLIAFLIASSFGLTAYRIPASHVPLQMAERDALARLWQRECLLLPVALYVDTEGRESEFAQSGQTSAVTSFLSRVEALTFLDVRETWSGFNRPVLSFDVAKPTAMEQRAVWKSALGDKAGNNPDRLAGQFDLNASTIRQIAASELANSPAERSLEDRLWAAALATTRPRLDAMAQRLDPKPGWEDLILPKAEMDLLQRIADQVGQRSKVYQDWGFGERISRGLGITALFAGESGTGKSTAAEVLAKELQLNLYRIDLSAVVSKYIGETERNLRKLFDAAEEGGAILFFDEADALFGKRSEVKDSHDRYANIEVSYLLQRMESYRGLAILATNMRSALDPAFLRRLRFVVTFPFPGTAERKRIWQCVFPPKTPTDALDFDWLARLAISGGNIHAVAVNAAFAAARNGGAVTMPVVLEAARAEFRKLNKPINEADFRSKQPAGAVA